MSSASTDVIGKNLPPVPVITNDTTSHITMAPVSKVLRDGSKGDESTMNPMMFVTMAMLMSVAHEWHTKLTAVSGHVRSNNEKTTKDMMYVAQQLMMMKNMLMAIGNAVAELKSRVAVIEDAGATNQYTPPPTVSPMCHSPNGDSPKGKKPKPGSPMTPTTPMSENELEKFVEQLIAGNGQVAANEAAAEAEAKANAAHKAEVEKKALAEVMELLKKETPGHQVNMTTSLVHDLLELSPLEFIRSINKMVENNDINADQGENLMSIFVNSPRRQLRFDNASE